MCNSVAKFFSTKFCHDFATKLLLPFEKSGRVQEIKKTCKSLNLQVLHVFLRVFEKFGKACFSLF